jgi:hypothetical protein
VAHAVLEAAAEGRAVGRLAVELAIKVLDGEAAEMDRKNARKG